MKKHIILSLALCSLIIGGTSAIAGQGTVTAIYVDINCGGFVQFSDAPSIWVGVPQSATSLLASSTGVGVPQSATTSTSTASISAAPILVWQTLNNAFVLNSPVTYTLSENYCGQPALLYIITGNPR
jgi:hypothetical protein